ncbi:MAG: DNA helicase RecQ [Anaerolineae bacterium]|nr:DNA helicase RecQ [Anaerolineae bacterium]
MTTPQSILKETFGYDAFLPFQHEVIENVLDRRDTLAVMPTGGGKSLCYQIPALLFEGLTVVISPLISLMKDQVEQLRAVGVPALFLNSSLQPEEYQTNMERVRSGVIKLLYVAPETLLTPRLFSLLTDMQVDCLTIDEAHCISEWGHDFRPEYRQLVDVRRRFPDAVCLALTATATMRVRSDIKASLGFSQSNEFVASFDRPNLYIEVVPKDNPAIQTARFLERFKDQSGIIYCFSRKQVDDLADFLTRRGYLVRPYHAGLADDERRRNQEAFIRDDVQIIVATIAFGMGINKPDVRFVLHHDLPKSIESYYQEIGRAGRDGLPAHCLLLYSYNDVAKLRYFINRKDGTERQVAVQHLDAIVRYAEDEVSCRRKPLLEYFGEAYTAQSCDNCDNCTGQAAEQIDITIPAQKFLSCVKRTGERFGAVHVTRVLLGSKDKRILQAGHDRLSTYGIGRELTRKQWAHLSRQMVQMGYLNQDGEYKTLSLTRKAYDALKNRLPIMGHLQEAEERASKKAREVASAYDQALFTLLRAKRKELADEAGVPPYVIFPDRALMEMAAYYPQSDARFLDISGVGQVKANQYGETFMAIIRDYCQEHDIPEGLKEVHRVKDDYGRRYMKVGEAFNEGETVESLMQQYQVKVGTILDHLARYMAVGHTLRPVDDILGLISAATGQQEAAFAAFDELGTAFLRPVFDRLEGSVSYDDLKALRLCYMSQAAEEMRPEG